LLSAFSAANTRRERAARSQQLDSADFSDMLSGCGYVGWSA